MTPWGAAARLIEVVGAAGFLAARRASKNGSQYVEIVGPIGAEAPIEAKVRVADHPPRMMEPGLHQIEVGRGSRADRFSLGSFLLTLMALAGVRPPIAAAHRIIRWTWPESS